MLFIARLMRIFFHHFYHSFAWTYDFVATVVSIGRWNEWIRTALPFIHGTEVLEIGHGPGYLQCLLHERFNFVVGIDESPQMSRLTQRRLKRAGAKNIKLARALAQAIPFCTRTFDAVVSTFPAEYIYSSATLSDIYRILKDQGCLIILPAAWIVGSNVMDRLAAGLFQITDEAPKDISSLVSRRMSFPLEQAGFSVRFERIAIQASIVMLVIARKPSQSS